MPFQKTNIYIFCALYILEVSKLLLLGCPIVGVSFWEIFFFYELEVNISRLVLFYFFNVVFGLIYPFLVFSNKKIASYLLLSYLSFYAYALVVLFMGYRVFDREQENIIVHNLYENILICFYIVSFSIVFIVMFIKRYKYERNQKRGCVRVVLAERYLSITTMSVCGLHYLEPSAPRILLNVDADNQEIGSNVRLGMSRSKVDEREEFEEIWELNIVQKISEERDEEIRRIYKYRPVLRKMKFLSVYINIKHINIVPTENKGKGNTRGLSLEENIYLPLTATDEEIGAAIREGFNRCI